MTTEKAYTVSELNAAIRNMLEGRFPFITVIGEISNLRRPGSGHCYFTLKDAEAQIKAVLFRMQQRYLKELPKDGQQVICRGRISVYAPRGDYQLIVDTLTLHGTGVLQQAFEELKRRLAQEGLFDARLKKELPAMPAHITLVTSATGAAVHDFIRIARSRMPGLHMTIYPVAVQGEQAAPEMITAINSLNAEVETDIIVLCRGGGSLEDLWAFNDEQLARTIRASQIPVVSAVGHEIDFTIADFAADLRAPTPSGAAEMLLPDTAQLRIRLRELQARLCGSIDGRLERATAKLAMTEAILGRMTHPLDPLFFRLDHLDGRLWKAIAEHCAQQDDRLTTLTRRLQAVSPSYSISTRLVQLAHLYWRLAAAQKRLVECNTAGLARAAEVLNAVSPLATLARGYAIVRHQGASSTAVIRDVDQVQVNDPVSVTLNNGELFCNVQEIRKKR
ncbi:MAG: exodeoxyribonuclease VII large subunit [Desulfobulbus propionicus]|nr:MAG: exodeoxyribonuclease VII large subunit [Desulfobulbus propionicus]